ncbi:MAG: hypothetical protein ACD_58C00122G0009 [uncultured bacterium]|nr:MAG: hypothetical protein ACD_58C00122G0009 [uncultured bacterium]
MEFSDFRPHIIKKYRSKFVVALVTLIILIVGGTVVFKYIENWTWIDSFYFSVSTISTVGYGDTTPNTEIGRLAASAFILISVPIMLYAFYIFALMYFDQRFFRVEEKEKEIEKEIEEKKK